MPNLSHNKYIKQYGSPYPHNWLVPQNSNLWQGVSGANNPCPSGYRLPTEIEFNAEISSWSSLSAIAAFASPLKFPLAGWREHSTGSLSHIGGVGSYWTSTADYDNSKSIFFQSSLAGGLSESRAYGQSVRCIKD
jgi:hypothetical protein